MSDIIISNELKKLYGRVKMMSTLYSVPLYIAWKCRYFPQDIKYYIKYGYKD